jgi:hypothetical protein
MKSGAAWPSERQQAGVSKHGGSRRQLARAADEAGQLRRQIVRLDHGRGPIQDAIGISCERGQLIDCNLAAGRCQEICSLTGREAQMLGQQCGDLARGPALVGLNLLDGHLGAADPPRKLALREVERLASPPHPVAKRNVLVHMACLW